MSLSRQQLTLLGIFALFIAPVILVMLMRSSWWQYQPAGMKNMGHLVQPPAPLGLAVPEAIERKWLMLHVLDQPCGQTCVDHVTSLRQIHRATGRKSSHVAIVLLSRMELAAELSTRLNSIYPEFHIDAAADDSVFDTLDSINANLSGNTGQADGINTYILDPMRNVILAYGGETGPTDIHKDIKRLLKWSEQENR